MWSASLRGVAKTTHNSYLLCMASSRSWCLLVAKMITPSYCSIWDVKTHQPNESRDHSVRGTSVSRTPRFGLGRVSLDSNSDSHSSKNKIALWILASLKRNFKSSLSTGNDNGTILNIHDNNFHHTHVHTCIEYSHVRGEEQNFPLSKGKTT